MPTIYYRSAVHSYSRGLSLGLRRGRSLKSANTFCLLKILVIIQANDVESNPGPVEYPCGLCGVEVEDNDAGIECNDCKQWYHADCIHMNSHIYSTMGDADLSWHCIACGGMPQFNSSFYSSHSDLSTSSTDTSSLSAGSPQSPVCSNQGGTKLVIGRYYHRKAKGPTVRLDVEKM